MRAALAVLLLIPIAAWPCGFSEELPIFSFETRPENLTTFAGGELSFIQGKFEPKTLIVAYRVLVGKPLTAVEQKRFLATFELVEPGTPVDPVGVWMKARETVLKKIDPPQPYSTRLAANSYSQVLNCNADAFLTAAQTLVDRRKQYASDERLTEWVQAQDLVFEQCSKLVAIPSELPSSDPLVRADRAYQVAASHFYAGHYVTAAAAFKAIAADESSPWKKLAPYLEARALVRRGTIGDKGTGDVAALETAIAVMKKRSAARPADRNLRRLLAYGRLRVRPAEEARVLAQAFLVSLDRPDLAEELIDFDFALANPIAAEVSSAADDLSDWVCVMSLRCSMTDGSELPDAVASFARMGVAAEKWKQTRAPHWLLAALIRADARSADVPQLLAAIDALPEAWAGMRTARMEQLRLLTALRKTAEAQAVLDRLEGRTVAEKNRLRRARLEAPRDLVELATSAELVRVGGRLDGFDAEYDADTASCLDPRGAELLSRVVPVSSLSTLVTSNKLTAGTTRVLATVGFIRAALLDDETIARALLPHARAASPHLEARLTKWEEAKTKDERAFAIAHLLLESWGLGPHLQGNFCASDKPIHFTGQWWCPSADPADRPTPTFQTAGELETGIRERATLDAMGADIDYLTRVAIDFTKAHPKDLRGPEALSLAVKRARHHGCLTSGTTKLSKEAFRILHSLHKGSAAARRTPYWY